MDQVQSGQCRKRGQIYFNSTVEIAPRYFRPTEVEFLLGDLGKAKIRLGWQSEISFAELVKVMVREDLREAQRDQLCKAEGFKTFNNFE
ncbi:MAG: GDP-mannose 4,6-dehydratase [Pseudomonadota bacterium]|nr:GDP-mannose 4,6-dehydratase [Pseudomonadota bacterium]